MPLIERFDPPGNLEDLSDDGRQAWHDTVRAVFGEFIEHFPQFIDPTQTEVPDDAFVQPLSWGAFPATQRFGTDEQRWRRVDEDRGLQDEYCEWSVAKDSDGNVTAVTFTTETPEYFAHLFEVDEQATLVLYENLVGQPVTREQLQDAQGRYSATNALNARRDGPIAHLSQGSNTLGAAVRLAAEATVLRERGGAPVVDQQDLVRCGGLGEPLRGSDPQIAAAVNNMAAKGHEVTLAAPPGLYITGLLTNGITTPDGANPRDFWNIERGDADHILRARFEVPAELDYKVSDIKIGEKPIRFGSQLAERVGVGLIVVSYPAGHEAERQPCV